MLDILYQDDHILALNKPAGIPVLPDGWQPDAPYLRKMLETELGRIFVVHRLDKVTSGIMVFARTAEAHRRGTSCLGRKGLQDASEGQCR
jgi:23S rRNA-/tRNA-specific pseudouridylate synthase